MGWRLRRPLGVFVVALLYVALGACDGATRLTPGVPRDVAATRDAQRLRLPRGPVTLTLTPTDARGRVHLVRGGVMSRLVERPDFAPHQLAFADGDGVEVELSWATDAVVPGSSVRLEVTKGASPAAARLDEALITALARTSPPTAEGLAAAIDPLLRLAEDTAVDAGRAASARLAAGRVLARLGDPRARALFDACLSAPAPLTRATAHAELARLDQQEDQRAAAAQHLEQARVLAAGAPRLLGFVAWLEAEAMAERSEYSRVLAHLPPVLDSITALGDDGLASLLEAATGWAWREQGDAERAKAHFQAELALARRTDDGRLIGIALHNQGGIISTLTSDWAAALPFYEEAVAHFRAVGDLRGLAFSLDACGEMESTLERPIAIEHHREAATLRKRLGHVRGEGQTLVSLGSALTRLHRPDEAFAPIRAGIELFHRIGDTNWEAYGWFRLGRASLEARRFADAVAQARTSLAIAESVRERIASDDRRASYSGTGTHTYDLWVAAAMAQAEATGERRWFAEALEAYERSRARSLLEVVVRIDADRPEALKGRHDALRARIRALELDIRQERARPSSDALERLEATMRAQLAEYEALVAAMQAADPRAAQLGAVPVVTLDEAEALAGPDTLVVEYAFGRKASWALVLGGGAPPAAFRLPEPAKVRALAVALVDEVSARNLEVPGETAAARAARVAEADGKAQATREALRQAIVPFAARLGGKRRLAVVADDSLQRVPWGALVPEVAVVQAPSLSVVQAQRLRASARTPPTSTLTVVADPVFGEDDPRLSGLDGGVAAEARGQAPFRRLPFSALEGEALARLVPPAKRRLLTGPDATRERVLSGAVSASRLVHFATHGVLDLSTPERSGLVLAQRAPDGRPLEGFLSLADVYALRLSADLVTLSACETALGSVQRGEGLIGLARGFLHAGARAVVASLWKVNDKATALLMEAFYEGLLVRRLPAAVALANAQRAVAAMERYRAPYFWAGFVLVGDPKE
ncbi:MAG: CHAT domain-containing protein [Myxococcaceae bacterium]|nr:CHAT domain-containing protein [Myxococcaceae bacterium]MCA3010849.1 CHAT domain-containing protein [Myxococcaceae bacterium]